MIQVEDLDKFQKPENLHRGEKQTLLEKYRIPVHHLEPEYIEVCKDGKEMEKILQILRSGEEGYFPHLVSAAKERLNVIKPNSKFLKKTCPVLRTAEISKSDQEDITNDLSEWMEDVNKRDQELDERKIKSVSELIDIDIRKTKTVVQQNQPEQNPKRISSTDYELWDRYDPDTEILKLDLEDERMKKRAIKNEEEEKKSKASRVVHFKNFSTEAEAIYEANREKERGNECYKAGEIVNAVHHYTNSLQHKPLAAVYTNRALMYNKLKKYNLAINDCKEAIKIEPKCFKGYLRLAQNYKALNQYENALVNIEYAIKIDPNNEVAQELANQLYPICKSPTMKTRLKIVDVDLSSNSVTKPFKPILKNNPVKKEPEKRRNYEIVPIPGSSKMPPPYYKIIFSNDPKVIKKEEWKVFSKPHLMYMTIIDDSSDDDDCGDFDARLVKKYKSQLTIKDASQNELENFQFDDEEETTEHDYQINMQATETLNEPQQEIEEGGGGEPCNNNEEFFTQTLEELQLPYVFTQAWNSIKNDTSYKQYAEILRKLDFNRIHEVIGFNFDDSMFHIIINCLHKHFMVPGELDRLSSALTNITQIPRFKIMLMFLEETDRNCIDQLIQFLDQHGHHLPYNVKSVYTNN